MKTATAMKLTTIQLRMRSNPLQARIVGRDGAEARREFGDLPRDREPGRDRQYGRRGPAASTLLNGDSPNTWVAIGAAATAASAPRSWPSRR
jgi:hypothetical protein